MIEELVNAGLVTDARHFLRTTTLVIGSSCWASHEDNVGKALSRFDSLRARCAKRSILVQQCRSPRHGSGLCSGGEGLVGWGEAFGFGGSPVTEIAVNRVVAPLAIGQDPSDIAKLMMQIRRRVPGMGHNGPVGFALSGLDIALWDIAGKIADRPVYHLLGANGTKAKIPTYASLLRVDAPVHIRNVCAAALSRGYRYIKLHERSVEAVAAAREVVGRDYPLMLDTNCAWDLQHSMEMANELNNSILPGWKNQYFRRTTIGRWPKCVAMEVFRSPPVKIWATSTMFDKYLQRRRSISFSLMPPRWAA